MEGRGKREEKVGAVLHREGGWRIGWLGGLALPPDERKREQGECTLYSLWGEQRERDRERARDR